MQAKRQRFRKEQQIALLQEFVVSGLSGREYAALKKVGYSTLTKWAGQNNISLTKPAFPCEMPNPQTISKNDHREGFSFVNLTDPVKEASPGFDASLLFGQAVQENTTPCGLEIQMPNGVMLKVGQVPFGALWPQIVEFVRALA